MTRPARVTINLTALQHNLRRIMADASADQVSVNQPDIFVATKDNAYGHGLIPVARALIDVSDTIGFALCSLDEALELMQAGIRQPVLLLGGFFSSEELELISHYQLNCVVHSIWQVARITESRLTHPIKVWLKVNTGMNRLGFALQEVGQVYQQLACCTQVADIVLMSHLACADQPEHPLNSIQIDHFVRLARAYPESDLSLLNSAGIVNFYRKTSPYCPCYQSYQKVFDIDASEKPYGKHKHSLRKHWLRPGLMVYGASPLVDTESHHLGLQQSMTLKSNVISLYDVKPGQYIGYGATYVVDKVAGKPFRLAVVALGYGDGYPFVPSGTEVLVDGSIAEIVGRVSMDLITVDVTAVPGVRVGSEVVFWNQTLTINRLASKLKVAPQILMTGLTSRVKREYVS